MTSINTALRDRIRDAVASYRNDIRDLTKTLVAIPTENPPGASYLECVDVLASTMRELGMDPMVSEVPEVEPPRPKGARNGSPRHPRYCLSSFYGVGPRTLYFHGHYDVVPASSEGQFRPSVQGGKLFGRGSSDMKSGLAAMIYAVRAIKDCGIELHGRIGLTVVPDEETGGVLGSRYLADAGLLGQDGIGMLTPEPTSGVIWNANRGALSLRVTVRGKPAHVGMHYRGVNAFERMLVVANALLELKTEVECRRTAFVVEPEAARRSILLMGGQCAGGSYFNLVPGACSFTVDRRINPEEDLEAEKHSLFRLFDKLKADGIDLDVEILQEGRAAGSSTDGVVAEALSDSVQEVTGKTPSFEMCPGLLETRFYAEKGMPAFGYGPGLLSVSHGPDEFVKLDDVHACTAIYALTAIRLLAHR
jgi:succinyl-diaminopimelate desuccinylase